MKKQITLAVTGDSAIRRRLSVHKEEGFLSLVNLIRGADVAFTNMEAVIHDYDGPEVYPCESGGGTWSQVPNFMAEELKWCGFNLISRANNHSLDYSYGGMFNTSKVLDEAGLIHAGVGKNLAEAREPAYLETAKGRVALISMCSTFTRWGRAGEQRNDVKGRPGLNPLRYYCSVDSKKMETIKDIAVNILNMEHFQEGNVHYFVKPGTHNSVYKFVENEDNRTYRIALEEDVEGNLRYLREARKRSDLVIIHLHAHEWELGKGREVPGEFIQPFAHRCIDEGADAFICQGAHTLRGIEVYKRKPIFYEPQSSMGFGKVTRLPSGYYENPMYQNYSKIDLNSREALVLDALESRVASPLGQDLANQSFEAKSAFVGYCTFGEDKNLIDLKIYPKTRKGGKPPTLANEQEAKKIIDYINRVSSMYGTEIMYKDGIGQVVIK